jgi:hypothetical protein
MYVPRPHSMRFSEELHPAYVFTLVLQPGHCEETRTGAATGENSPCLSSADYGTTVRGLHWRNEMVLMVCCTSWLGLNGTGWTEGIAETEDDRYFEDIPIHEETRSREGAQECHSFHRDKSSERQLETTPCSPYSPPPFPLLSTLVAQ